AHPFLLRLLRGEAGDLLEAGPSLGLLRPQRPLAVVKRLLPAPQLAGLGLEARQLLRGLVLASLDLAPPPSHLLVPHFARPQQLRFRGEDHPLARFGQEALVNPGGRPRRGGDDLSPPAPARPPPPSHPPDPPCAGRKRHLFGGGDLPWARLGRGALLSPGGGPRRGGDGPPLHTPPHDIESHSRGEPTAREGC